MPKRVKKKEDTPELSDYEEEEQYQVEVITRARVTEDCDWEYYVKWAGFGEESNSWEPYDNVASCDRLLKSFWDNIGSDNNDYPPGYEAVASKDWVGKSALYFVGQAGVSEDIMSTAREKRYFTTNFSADPTPKKTAKAIAFTVRASDARGNKKVARKPVVGDPESSEEDKGAPRKPHNKRTQKPVNSDDSDNQPLRKARKVAARESGSKAKAPRKASSSKASTSTTSTQKRVQAAPSSSKVVETFVLGSPEQSPSIARQISNGKGKERAVTPPPTEPTEQTSPHSLFSAPSSPEVFLSQLPVESAAPPAPPTEATSAPTEMAPAKGNLPAHVQRKVHPKIKMLDIPSLNQTATTGISTKQRLAMGAATISPVTPSVPQLSNQTLSQLKLTKRKNSTQDTRSTISPQIASAGSSSLASGFGRPNPAILPGADLVQSPVDDYMAVDNDASHRLPLPRTHTKPIPPRLKAQADSFLAEIMPDAMAAPISEHAAPKEPPRPIMGPPVIPSGRIQKKFKWEGDLLVDSPQGGRHHCKVTMNEASDPRPLGLQLKICLSEAKSIKLHKLYNVSDVYAMLRGCAATTQFCKLVPQGDEDKAPFKSLERHMKKNRLFSFASTYLDDDPVGLLIVFPPTFDDLCKLFRLPANLRTQEGLAVALCPYELPMVKLEKFDWMEAKYEDFRPQGPYCDPAYADMMRGASRKLVVGNTSYQRGLRILKFPKQLHDFMSRPNRTFCIWHGQPSASTVTTTPTEVETMYLQAILSHCGATNVGLKSDVRVIFIHIGSLLTMGKIPSMSARRSKRPEIRFFTYGTDSSVHPSRWGIKEVYPMGGIVTFTAKAIMEDIFGVCKLINKLEIHPFWTCFIPPAVVGAVAKLTSGGIDPLKLLDQKESFCERLLNLIEGGRVSLLTAPPQIRHPKQNEDKTGWTDLEMMWISGQFSLITMGERGILEACMRAFDSLYSTTPERELSSKVGMHAMQQMDRMQYQPVLMDDYRRYVVVTGSKEDLVDKADLVEIAALPMFDFREDFFLDKKPRERKSTAEAVKA